MRLCAFQPDIAPNLGAMIRLGACFGVPLDIVEPCGFPLSIKSLRRAAMDYADIADIARHDSWQAFQTRRGAGRLVLMTTKAEASIWDFRFERGDTIMVGRESAGVPDTVAQACDARLRIPMSGTARSLNVAMCAGMALSEALRQTR